MGTLIHGTLRPEDLIPRFADLFASLTELGNDHPLVIEARSISDFNSEDACIILEELMDEIDFFAPADQYFGAHTGDGSDFGFWPLEDM